MTYGSDNIGQDPHWHLVLWPLLQLCQQGKRKLSISQSYQLRCINVGDIHAIVSTIFGNPQGIRQWESRLGLVSEEKVGIPPMRLLECMTSECIVHVG